MRYIVSILIVLITFTACSKKEVINYNPNKIKIIKDNKDTVNENIQVEEEMVELNTTIEDLNNSIDMNISNENNITLDNNITNVELLDTNNSTVAIIYSSKRIGKYSIKVSDVILAYSSINKDNFEYKFYDIENENNESITNVFNTLKENNINNVIFYLTPNSLTNLYGYSELDDFNIYLPLINIKKANEDEHKYLIFGAIDYEKQLNSLIGIANSHIIEVYDEKRKNLRLHSMLENNEAITSYQIKGRYPNYKSFIRQHRQIKNSSLILNLDIVKSSIFMSQISANDKIYVKQILSTQNNYSPLLFVLTQQKDRTKLIIASSINETNEKLYSVNKLLGNDIRYDWVNYSTIVGLELLKTKKSILFDNIEVINNQVQYPSILYKTNKNSFVPYVNK